MTDRVRRVTVANREPIVCADCEGVVLPGEQFTVEFRSFRGPGKANKPGQLQLSSRPFCVDCMPLEDPDAVAVPNPGPVLVPNGPLPAESPRV